jgi:hypothetical protein
MDNMGKKAKSAFHDFSSLEIRLSFLILQQREHKDWKLHRRKEIKWESLFITAFFFFFFPTSYINIFCLFIFSRI